jgi:hypothetical protein
LRTDGQTDRHDEAASRFSQFCEVPHQKWWKFMKLLYSTAELKLKKKTGGKTAVFHSLLLKLWCGAINQIALEKRKGQIAHL